MKHDQRQVRKDLQLAEEAAEWLYKLQSGELTEHTEYVDWLLESPRNVEAFLRVSSVDASLQRVDIERSIEIVRVGGPANDTNVVPISADEDGAPDLTIETSRGASSAIPQAVHKRRWLTTLAASGAILGVVAAGIWAFSSYEATRWHQYATLAGERQAFVLKDGSLLQLNSDSRVAVRYSGNERSVRLDAGEALFKVQHDTTRPFKVYASNVVVQAVGTEFDVRRSAGEAFVAVLEGRVRVDARTAESLGDSLPVESSGSAGVESANSSKTLPAAVRPTDSVFLSAGEEARVANDGSLKARGTADLARVRAWREVRLVFVNEPLEKVLAEFNRYNSSPKIRIEGSGNGVGQFFTVSFDARDPESLLAVLERDSGLVVERRGDEVIVRAR